MAVQTLDVAAGADDGFGYPASTFTNSSTTLFFGDDGSESRAFMRFLLTADLTGATIDSAFLTGIFAEAVGVEIDVYAADAADPNAPTDFSELDGITPTTATVYWNPDPTGGGGSRTSPDLKTVIQELVDSYTMANGDAIVIKLDPTAYTNTGVNEISSYDHATDAPPELEITYTVAPQTSGTINGGGSIAATVVKHLNQELRPDSTVAAGSWDTGPTTGQSLHGYASDASDSTYVADTTA